MAVTLELKFSVGGVLTNATSVLLSSSDGTYGVKRMDTDAVVVADGTAMTNFATGVYRHTFVAPAASLQYSWVAEVLYNGVTYRFEREHQDDVGESPEGAYASWAGIKEILGDVNARLASQLDNAVTTADLVRVAADIAFADAFTNRRARVGGFETPILDTSADWLLVQTVTNLYAAYWLVRHRFWDDIDSTDQQKVVGLEAEAMELYDRLFGPDPGGLDAPETPEDPNQTWTNVTLERVPVCVEDENSGD